MASIPLPVIKLGKRKENSQMAHVSTTDGRCLQEEIPVTANSAVSDKHACFFILDDTEQYQGKDGHFYQLLSDKSALPLMPKSEFAKRAERAKQLESATDNIFNLTEDEKIYENFMNAKKNDRGDVIKWCVSFAFAAFTIIGAIAYLKG